MDLSTSYMGLKLKNPIVPSASPLSENIDNIKQMEDAGASAVVLYSLFEEQINAESQTLDHFLSYGSGSFAEALSYFPEPETFKTGPDGYLELIRQAKNSVDIPIIASLNGVSTGGWIQYANKIQEAGADALELNIYYLPTSNKLTGSEVEQMYVDVVHNVKQHVSLPLAVKLSPYFSATANMAAQLREAGADALVLFNRFYQPDLDLDKFEVNPSLVLSSSSDLRLALRWIAILRGQIDIDLAITNGVHTHIDILKSLMAGANVTMLAAKLLKEGIDSISQLLQDLVQWMQERDYESVQQMIGSMSHKNVVEPAAFERANYMKALHSWRPDPSATGFHPPK
jgi:dihydroorotate dehydrogenase (fumarate)